MIFRWMTGTFERILTPSIFRVKISQKKSEILILSCRALLEISTIPLDPERRKPHGYIIYLRKTDIKWAWNAPEKIWGELVQHNIPALHAQHGTGAHARVRQAMARRWPALKGQPRKGTRQNLQLHKTFDLYIQIKRFKMLNYTKFCEEHYGNLKFHLWHVFQGKYHHFYDYIIINCQKLWTLISSSFLIGIK